MTTPKSSEFGEEEIAEDTTWVDRVLLVFGLARRSRFLASVAREAELEKEWNSDILLYRSLTKERNEKLAIAEREIAKLQADFGGLEDHYVEAERSMELAQARVTDLEGQISYLQKQVEIYQQRLGLISPRVETQGSLMPARKAREPFAQAQARVQVERTEKYWRERAAATDIEGISGVSVSEPPSEAKTEEQ
jgi:chromosome segregation ATPase